MIPVTNLEGTVQPGTDREFMMVPTGGFSPDENGFLRTTSGLYLLGWPTDASGNTNGPSRGSPSELEPVNANTGQFSAESTRNITLGVNLPANAVGTESFDLPLDYFDALGLSESLNLTFTPNAGVENSWRVSITDSAGDPTVSIASFDVDFNDQESGGSISEITPVAGVTYDEAAGEITFNVEGGPIEAFIGRPDETAGFTQLGTSFTPYNVVADGSPVGNLTNIEINSQGFMEALYDTGFRRTLYQIPVAEVPNANGLNAIANQAYTISQESGSVYFWDAGEGPAGDYVGYSLMQSSTDIAQELTSLIETQRAYSSNAKIIQTVDEMLQETTNLKR